MHELFTTAVVPNDLVDEMLKVLQGLCGMTPMRKLERRLVFEGPKAPPLLGITAPQLQNRKQGNIPLWRELHEQLVRQSYYITASYDVDEAQFGENIQDSGDDATRDFRGMDLNETKGTLQFLDNPDPPGMRPVNSRLAVYIRDESHLPAFLGQINYSFSSEQIREAYYAYRENIIFRLSRDLRIPKEERDPTNAVSRALEGRLPTFSDFKPFDAENKWALTALAQVSDGSQPALMQKGLDQLAQVKHEFTGILDFGMIPRRQLDTRVLSFNQSMRT